MALFTSVLGFYRQQPGTTVTWSVMYPNGQDRRVVVQAPNISDDIIGSVELDVLQQGVVATNSGLLYLVTISNSGTQSVQYNLNVWDPL